MSETQPPPVVVNGCALPIYITQIYNSKVLIIVVEYISHVLLNHTFLKHTSIPACGLHMHAQLRWTKG